MISFLKSEIALHAQSTKELDKDRKGASDQAWHRAKAARTRHNMMRMLRLQATQELKDAEDRIRQEQKDSYNANAGSMCKKICIGMAA